MKKTFRCVVVLLALVMILASTSALAKTTVTMWSSYASPYTRPTVDKLVEMFNERNPDIELVHLPVSSRMMEKFQTSVVGREAPDLIITGITSLYDPAGKSRDEIEKESPFVYLDDFVDPAVLEDWQKTYYQDGWLKLQNTYRGPYALPFEVSAEVMFYNKELFRLAGLDPEAPPTTMDEFHAAAEKITEAATAAGTEAWGYLFEAKVPSEVAWLENFAGPLNDQVVPLGYRKSSGEYVLTAATEKNAAALDAFYRDPYQNGWTGKVLGYDYMTARAAFGQGKVGMYRIGSYMMIVYNLQYPDLEYGIAELPNMDPNGGFVDAGTASYWFMTKEKFGGHPKEAAKVLEFLGTAEAQALMIVEAGKLVANRQAFAVEGLPSYTLQAQSILDKRLNAQKAFTQRQIDRYPDIEHQAMGELIVTSAQVPAAIAGGRIINSAGTMFQQYLEGQISAKDMLTRLETEWAMVLQREGLKVDRSSVGWERPAER